MSSNEKRLLRFDGEPLPAEPVEHADDPTERVFDLSEYARAVGDELVRAGAVDASAREKVDRALANALAALPPLRYLPHVAALAKLSLAPTDVVVIYPSRHVQMTPDAHAGFGRIVREALRRARLSNEVLVWSSPVVNLRKVTLDGLRAILAGVREATLRAESHGL